MTLPRVGAPVFNALSILSSLTDECSESLESEVRADNNVMVKLMNCYALPMKIGLTNEDNYHDL